MKKYVLKLILAVLTITLVFIVYFSTIGIETDKFNDQIKNKIILINKNIDVDLKKIKLTLDPLKLKIYAKTVDTIIYFSEEQFQLEYIKSEVSLISFIKKKIISSNIEIKTNSLSLKNLIKFIRSSNNKPQIFILEKIVKKGHIFLDLRLNIDDNGNVKNDYEIRGFIKDATVKFLNQEKLEDISFNFNLKHNNYLLRELRFKTQKVNFIAEKINVNRKNNNFLVDGNIKNNQSNLNLNILESLNLNFEGLNLENVKFTTNNNFSLEVDNKYNIKNVILNSDIRINQFKYKKPDLVENYFSEINDLILFKNHQFNLNYKNNNLSIKGEGEFQLENQIDKVKYLINKKNKKLNVIAELSIENFNLKKQDSLNNFFPEINDKINFKNQKIKINYNNKNISFSGSGKFKIDKDFEDIKYFFEKKKNYLNFDTELSLKKTNFKISDINYKKNDSTKMNLKIQGQLKNNRNLNIYNFNISEENNKIKIINLSLNNLNQFIAIDQADFNYLDNENKINKYTINKVSEDNYIISGISFNANSLISNLLKDNNKKQNNYFKKNKNIIFDLNIKKAFIDKMYFVNNLKGEFTIKNNKVIDANIRAFFDNSENISFTIDMLDNGEKVTTLFSSKAKPLVNRYKFIKGFQDTKEGFLDFSSSKKDGVSNSKLIIDNFKVKEIPALAKILTLASLQGIADLLTGEGIRFTDFEMKFKNDNKIMKIDELYAIGPAISIMLEGYIEEDNLISLRGTLVPATTINRSIASIPLIGDLLVGKKVGDGVFGVSFKIKGPPKDLETSVNPIKTLTPRFITRTLEKIKKN